MLIAEENSDLFIPLQNYSYSLEPQSVRSSMQLPSTAGRIRLQMYLMSGFNKVDMHDLLINGVKSSDQESFVIENPLAWIFFGIRVFQIIKNFILQKMVHNIFE